MPRIQPLTPETAQGAAADILSSVKKKMGMIPNIVATMANAPSVANAYLAFSGAVGEGRLPGDVRERIALTTGQSNECNYCLSAHTLMGKGAGLSQDEIVNARQGTSDDNRVAAAVAFARKLSDNRGNVTDEDLAVVRDAGYDDGEIAEIVANVALNIFTNYFNHVADPEIDFPLAPPLQSA
jgi:uncharacterized peroxidase-related enzyme